MRHGHASIHPTTTRPSGRPAPTTGKAKGKGLRGAIKREGGSIEVLRLQKPKQHSMWAPVGPQLGHVGPQLGPTGAHSGMLIGKWGGGGGGGRGHKKVLRLPTQVIKVLKRSVMI